MASPNASAKPRSAGTRRLPGKKIGTFRYKNHANRRQNPEQPRWHYSKFNTASVAARSGKKKDTEAFAEEVSAALKADIEVLVGKGIFEDGDFEAVERGARDVALRVAGTLVAQHINSDHSDMQGPRLACDCGEDAHYAGRRNKTVTTALGPMTLERAWYHCEACGAGFAPRDRGFGFDKTSLSPAVLRMVGFVASNNSFETGSRHLHELAALRIDAKTVERQAEALGREVAEDELNVVVPEPCEARTLYLGLDGTGIAVRKSEVEGRKGKQADGSAKTREVKLALVWSAEKRDRKTGLPVRDPGSVSSNGAIESVASRDTDPEASPFARRIERELERRCFHEAERQVTIGDGASWIWNFTAEHLPEAIQIVDIFQYAEFRIMPSNLSNRLIPGSSSPDFSA